MLYTLIFVVLAALAPFCLAVEGDDVVVLTAGNFDSQTATGTCYAPWCGHCKRLAPIWSDLATSLKGKVNVAKVDCTVERPLAQKFGIRGFPTIKMIKDGKVYSYKGTRTVEAFTSFIETGYTSAEVQDISSLGTASPSQEKSKAASGNDEDVVVLTDSEFASKTGTGAWLVKFYAPWCGHCKKLAPTWASLATAAKDKDYNIAKVDCTVEKSVCKSFGIRGYPTIKLVKDGKYYDFRGSRTIEDFQKFVEGGYVSAPSGDAPGTKDEL